jgi:hypothetical protein
MHGQVRAQKGSEQASKQHSLPGDCGQIDKSAYERTQASEGNSLPGMHKQMHKLGHRKYWSRKRVMRV